MTKNNWRRTLVLNQSYMPLSLFPLYTIPSQEAIFRTAKGNCTVVTTYDDRVIMQNDKEMFWPAVIANHNNHSFKKDLRLRKESLFYRDHCKCAYCGRDLTVKELTFDHVMPTSKGGIHAWDNVVASCKNCNNKKSDSLSKEWKPKHAPWTPTFYQMLEIRKKYPMVVDHESWIQFLPVWTAGIYVKDKKELIMPNGDRIKSKAVATPELFRHLELIDNSQ